MPNQPNKIGQRSLKSKESPPVRHRRPLIELEDPGEIVERLTRVIDDSRGRATLLLGQEAPLLIDLRYRYRETAQGIVLLHDDSQSHDDERRASLEADVKDIAALFARDSLQVSGLRETPRNIRRMLDFVIGTIFSDTRISGDIHKLTSSHRRNIEKTLNGPASKNIPSLRRALMELFEALFLIETDGEEKAVKEGDKEKEQEPEKKLALRRGRERGTRSSLDTGALILNALTRRRDQDSSNNIYDLIHRPGISIEAVHNGRRRMVKIMSLLEAYVEAARQVTLERNNDIESGYNTIQADAAIDGIIGKTSADRFGKKERAKVVSEIEENVAESVDPVVHAALELLASK